MASSPLLQTRRRSAGQLRALLWVERQIRECHPQPRHKYLREFHEAFASYESVATVEELGDELRRAEIILLGDYHALPASQLYAVKLLEQLQRTGRPVVLGLEALLARDQRILDSWLRSEIGDDELRQRLRFDAKWGFHWEPLRQLLRAARRSAVHVYALDCEPRADFRAIAVRDRHAALKIADIRKQHPETAVLVLFGESHLAPQHLPAALAHGCPGQRTLTVLQNIDSMYWQAAQESGPVHAVRVREGAYCVLHSTPLEKRESYRLCLERWRECRPRVPDLEPTFHNLLDSLLFFFNIDKYAVSGLRFLVDLLPEIAVQPFPLEAENFLRRRGLAPLAAAELVRRIEARGSLYLPEWNTILVQRFQLTEASEDVARFLHRACSGARDQLLEDQDSFYAATLSQALAYVGSRVLNPARPRLREPDLYALYTMTAEEIEARFAFPHRNFLRMVDFLVLHKDFEANARRYYHPPALITEAIAGAPRERLFMIEHLGNMLGTQLFESFVEGALSKRALRALLFDDVSRPGAARELYFSLAAKLAPRPRRLAA